MLIYKYIKQKGPKHPHKTHIFILSNKIINKLKKMNYKKTRIKSFIGGLLIGFVAGFLAGVLAVAVYINNFII